MPHKWTAEEDKFLKDNWHKISSEEMVKALSKSHSMIGDRANRLGLPHPYATKFKSAQPPVSRCIWRQTSMPGILVSDFGELWNANKGIFIKTDGVKFTLSKNGKITYGSLPRLVYETFKGPIPDGLIVYHKDNNTLNNDLNNLGLTNQGKLFAAHARRSRGKPVVVFVNNVPVKRYMSVSAYAREKGISPYTVYNYLNNRTPNQRSIKEDIRLSNVKVRDPRRT